MTIIWSVVIALALITEIFTFELVSIWFAVGGIVALVLELCGVELVWQLVAFFIISIIAIILTRPLFKRILAKAEGNTNLDVIIGEKYRVFQPIIAGNRGTVKINGVVWNAEEVGGESCEVGDEVAVVEFKGTTVRVKKINKNKEEEK